MPLLLTQAATNCVRSIGVSYLMVTTSPLWQSTVFNTSASSLPKGDSVRIFTCATSSNGASAVTVMLYSLMAVQVWLGSILTPKTFSALAIDISSLTCVRSTSMSSPQETRAKAGNRNRYLHFIIQITFDNQILKTKKSWCKYREFHLYTRIFPINMP